MKMGFMTWFKRKMDETKIKNDARAEALEEYYKSDEYKKTFAEAEAKKIKEGSGSKGGDWLKRVSKNAAKQFENGSEKPTMNIEKFLGK